VNREELEGLTKPELVELVLRLQHPDKISRTSSKPPSTEEKQSGRGRVPAARSMATRGMPATSLKSRTSLKITARRIAFIAARRLLKMRQAR